MPHLHSVVIEGTKCFCLPLECRCVGAGNIVFWQQEG